MTSPHPLIPQLSIQQQAILAALTCEKLLPSIAKFDEQEVRQGRRLFEQAIAALFAFGQNEPLPLSAYEQFQHQVAAFWPDLDESLNDYASYAFDACGALMEALLLVASGELRHLLNCLTAATDTVDMYVQEVQEQELNLAPAETTAFVEASATMQQERQRQARLIQALRDRTTIDQAFLMHLQQLNSQQPLVYFTAL